MTLSLILVVPDLYVILIWFDHLAKYLLFSFVPVGIWVTGLPDKAIDSYHPWKLKPFLVGVGRVSGSWVALNEVTAPEGLVPLFRL
jgi:hypothetical protein